MNDVAKAVIEMLNECNELIAEGKCPGCAQPLVPEFRDELSRREYEISGLCQQCQDEVFGHED